MLKNKKVLIVIAIAVLVILAIIGIAVLINRSYDHTLRKELEKVAANAKITPQKVYIDDTQKDPIILRTAFNSDLNKKTGVKFVVINKLVDAKLKSKAPKVGEHEALFVYSKEYKGKLGAVFVIYNMENNEVKVSVMNPENK